MRSNLELTKRASLAILGSSESATDLNEVDDKNSMI